MKNLFRKPINLSSSFPGIFDYNDIGKNTLNHLTIRDVFITYSGIGSKYFKLIPETVFDNVGKYYFWFYSIYYRFFKPKIYFNDDKNFLIINNFWSSGYHHWLAETITKLVTLDTSKYSLIIPENFPQFAFDSLNCFKFHEIIKIPHRTMLYFKSLTVIENQNSGYYSPDILQKYRDKSIKYLDNLDFKHKYSKKLYISRINSKMRFVENENELIPILDKFGFEIIYPEKMTFWEQVFAFSKCNYLISIHGAGLTNCIFMPDNSSVFELMRTCSQNKPMNMCFYRLTNAMDFNYFVQFGKHGKNLGKHIDKVNIVINKKEFEQNIIEMLKIH